MLKDFDLEPAIAPLLKWFTPHARSLPWRDHPSPYHVWLSEIMLQQTRVEAVKPYYARFLKSLPDIASLAHCPEERLLKLWEGLGYYNRVRNMQKAALQVMEDYDGSLPPDYEKLRSLKGIGSYTAGAIASIAYGIYVPAVDGNVLRILTRLTADNTDIARASFRSQAETVLSTLMNRLKQRENDYPHVLNQNLAGMLNQALMELGATVCLPNGEPLCGVCPWNGVCLAQKRDIIHTLPVKSKPKARRQEKRTVFLIRQGNRIALHRRPASGLLAGLYEFPNIEGHYPPEKIKALFAEKNLAIASLEPLTDARHIFSHIEWQMAGYAVWLPAKTCAPENASGDTQPSLSSERASDDAQPSLSSERASGDTQPSLSSERASGDAPILPAPAELIFVEPKQALRDYAIPSAFAAYAKYLEFMN